MYTDKVFGVEDAVLVLDKAESRYKLALGAIAAAGRFGKLAKGILADMLRSAYLARGVDNLGCKVVTPVLDDLAECVFDCGIVAVHKMPVDELHRERGFA